MQIKRVLSYVLALALSFSLAVPALAAETFTDVSPTDWYYSYVTQCVEKGLMEGMGDGTFAPESKMTVAQFITVAVKASYASELANQAGGSNWWDKAYLTALDKGLITANEYANTSNAMNTPITRKEMARIASRVTAAKGEYREQASSSIIPDYSSIGQDYRADVLNVYGKGILAGIDEKGTFNPDGVLTRAEACTVALKIVDPAQRTPKSTSTDAAANTGTEYREGETRTNLPQVGDVIIKADGTRVTLALGPGGVLGACQGVDIYSGLVINGKTVEIGKVYGDIGQTPLLKDPITGEVHTGADWSLISHSDLNPEGKYIGDYDGEVFNTWWKWNSAIGDWIWIGPNN